MRARLIRLAEISPRDLDAWRVLSTCAAEPNPFFESEFVIPLARHHALEMTLLVVDVGTEMVACLPLYGHERPWRLLPLSAWTAPNTLGIPLAQERHATAALAVAIEYLTRHSGRRRLLVVDRVPGDGPVGAAFRAAVRARRPAWGDTRTSSSPLVRRRPTGKYLDETLRGKRRQTIARKRRNLERELGSSLELRDRGADSATIDRFLSMEASGWKGRAGTAMLADASRAAFFREMCARFAAQDRLRFFSLEAAGTSVAMKCQVVSGRGLYNLKTAYDERFARFSPGVLLEIEAVQYFHECGFDFMDACTNHENSPQFWLYPDSRQLTRMAVVLGGRATRLAISGLETVLRLYRRVVRGPGRPDR